MAAALVMLAAGAYGTRSSVARWPTTLAGGRGWPSKLTM